MSEVSGIQARYCRGFSGGAKRLGALNYKVMVRW